MRNRLNRSIQFLLFASLIVGDVASLFAAEPAAAARPVTDEERRSAAVALNYSRAALYRIRRYPTTRVMVEERDKILNHLDLNGIADEDVMKLYSGVLDEVSHVQMADREKEAIQEQYYRNLNRDLGINAFQIAAEVATQQYFSAVKTGASSWWDHRNKTVTKEQDRWQVDKKLMTSVVEKSNQFLDTSWKMARNKQIPDRWLIRNDDLEKLEVACRENDPTVRLRMLKRMESFQEYYPPYWYYVARTQQNLGQFVASAETYNKLATLSTGHFRKDEMLAAGLANRAYILAYLGQPGAAESAAKALTCSSDAWEANLLCASVLQRFNRHQDAEEAILRNIDDKLEKSQSRVALLGLYYQTDNRPELAARLTDPEWVRDVPVPQLILCAAKLSPATPQPVVDQIQVTMQATPRLNFGKDDFLLSASPSWQLQNAQVALHIGEKTFTNPRFTPGRDSMLVSFDGIAEFGGPMNSAIDDRDLSVTIKYPNAAPVKLTLKSGGTAISSSETLGNLGLAARTYPVYRATALEQNDLRLSLRTGPSAEITDITVPVSRTTIKPDLDEASDSGDSEPTHELRSGKLPGNPGTR